jgi:hypothetical protein
VAYFNIGYQLFVRENTILYKKLVREIIQSTKMIQQLQDILSNLNQGVALFNLNSHNLAFSNKHADDLFKTVYGDSELQIADLIQENDNFDKPVLIEYDK